jgi:hypothetical protein
MFKDFYEMEEMNKKVLNILNSWYELTLNSAYIFIVHWIDY